MSIELDLIPNLREVFAKKSILIVSISNPKNYFFNTKNIPTSIFGKRKRCFGLDKKSIIVLYILLT